MIFIFKRKLNIHYKNNAVTVVRKMEQTQQTITLDEKIRQRELKDFQLYKQFIEGHKNDNTLYSIWQTEQLEHYDVNQIKTNKKDATDISVQYIELKYRDTVSIDDYDNLLIDSHKIKYLQEKVNDSNTKQTINHSAYIVVFYPLSDKVAIFPVEQDKQYNVVNVWANKNTTISRKNKINKEMCELPISEAYIYDFNYPDNSLLSEIN